MRKGRSAALLMAVLLAVACASRASVRPAPAVAQTAHAMPAARARHEPAPAAAAVPAPAAEVLHVSFGDPDRKLGSEWTVHAGGSLLGRVCGFDERNQSASPDDVEVLHHALQRCKLCEGAASPARANDAHAPFYRVRASWPDLSCEVDVSRRSSPTHDVRTRRCHMAIEGFVHAEVGECPKPPPEDHVQEDVERYRLLDKCVADASKCSGPEELNDRVAIEADASQTFRSIAYLGDINFEPAPKANLSIFGASTAPFEDTDARVRRDCGELAIQILWRNGKVLTVCPQITVFMPRFTPDSPGEGRSSGPWPIHFSGHLPQDPDVVAFDLHFRGKRLLHVARHDLRVQARRGTDGSLVIAVSGADASGNSYRTEGRDARMYPVIAGGFPVQPLKEAPCWRLFKNEGHALSIQVADAFSTFSFPLAPRE